MSLTSSFSRIIDSRFLRNFIILLTALIIRIHGYDLYPPFRLDELGEILRAGIFAEGQSPPYFLLANGPPHIGSFYIYLNGVLMASTGFNPMLPRLVSVILGSLTVLLTSLIGELLYGWKAGLIASILLLFSPGHILIASHVGWSASLTPFFLTLTIYLYLMALSKSSHRLLYFASLLGGITFQTHPTTIIPLGMMALHLLLKGGGLRNLKVIILSLTFFLLGSINLVILNIIFPLISIRFSLHAKWMGLSQPLTPQTYLVRLAGMSWEFARMISGITIPLEYLPTSISLLLLTVLGILLLLTVLSISWTALRGIRCSKMLLLYFILYFLLLPILIKGVRGFPDAWGPHYLQPLLPTFYLLLSYPLIRWFVGGRGKKLLLTFILLLIIVVPYSMLLLSYHAWEKYGYTNSTHMEALHSLISYEADIYLAGGSKTLIISRLMPLYGEKLIFLPLNITSEQLKVGIERALSFNLTIYLICSHPSIDKFSPLPKVVEAFPYSSPIETITNERGMPIFLIFRFSNTPQP